MALYTVRIRDMYEQCTWEVKVEAPHNKPEEAKELAREASHALGHVGYANWLVMSITESAPQATISYLIFEGRFKRAGTTPQHPPFNNADCSTSAQSVK